MRRVTMPPADKVDVKAELAVLRELLAGLKNVPDRGRLDRDAGHRRGDGEAGARQ